MSDFSRAVAYQAARDGFIAIAPDRLSPAVQQYAARIPSANGTIACLELRHAQIDAHVSGYPVATFALDDEGWSTALAFLSAKTGNRFVPAPGMDHVAMDMRAQQAGRGGQAGGELGDGRRRARAARRIGDERLGQRRSPRRTHRGTEAPRPKSQRIPRCLGASVFRDHQKSSWTPIFANRASRIDVGRCHDANALLTVSTVFALNAL